MQTVFEILCNRIVK